MKIQFEKLEFGTTFVTEKNATEGIDRKWIKISENYAIDVDDPDEVKYHFSPTEVVIV